MKKQITMKNMKKIIKSQNRSLTSLAVELEVSQEAISQYISGKIHPKLETIVKMANLLNTSTDYLLDLTDNPTKHDFSLNEKEHNIINLYRNLSDTEKIKVESYLAAINDLKKI